MGRPEDVAEAYLWLASDAAAFVHGAVLSVDGGLVIGT
jgi:3-oxoacyl-[acyl-carrier protein] reductase